MNYVVRFFLLSFVLLGLQAGVGAAPTLPSGEGWLKHATTNEWVDVVASALVLVPNKPVGAPLSFQVDSASKKMALGSTATRKFLTVPNVPAMVTRGISTGSAAASKLKFTESAISADRPMMFSAEVVGEAFKLKIDPNVYLASSDEKFIRAYSKDASGKYIVPIAASDTTAFTFELYVADVTKPLDGVASLTGLTLDSVKKDFEGIFNDIFKVPGKTEANYASLLAKFSAYVNAAMVLPGWTNPTIGTPAKSLRDIAVDLLNGFIADDKAPADSKKAAQALITTLNEQPIYLADPTTPPPALAVAANDAIVLKIAEGVYLGRDDAGQIKALKTHMLNPATHFTVVTYNTNTGRIVLGFDTSFVSLALASPFNFVVGSKQQLVDIVRDETNAKKFSFSYAGKTVAFTAANLGSEVTTDVTSFELVGPLSDVQKTFEGLPARMKTNLLPADIQNDIKTKFNSFFAQLGSMPGDWSYFVTMFDMYLSAVVSSSLKLEDVALTGVLGGDQTLKVYAVKLLNSIAGKETDAKNLAKDLLKKISAGLTATPREAVSVFALGDRVFVRGLSQDVRTRKTLKVQTSGKLDFASSVSVYDMATHISVGAYTVAQQSVVLQSGNLLFDAASGVFVAEKQIAEVQPLTMEAVVVGSATYYYLKNAEGKRMTLVDDDSGVVFNSTGSLFEFAKVSNDQAVIDDLKTPAVAADLERDLTMFLTLFDSVSGDTVSLAYLIGAFDSYCQKGSSIASWDKDKSSSGALFRDYARSILNNVVRDLSGDLKTSGLKFLSDSLALKASSPAVAQQIEAESPPVHVTSGPAYASLNGATGKLDVDFKVFDTAVKDAAKDQQKLQDVIKALEAYMSEAVTRFAWIAEGKVLSKDMPKDMYADLLATVLRDDWYYTGLTPDVTKQIQDLVKNAENLSLSFPAQITMLDEYAKKMGDASELNESTRVVMLLKFLIPALIESGSQAQRFSVLKKIETYTKSKTAVPALLRAADGQKNAWTTLLFGLAVQFVSTPTTTGALLMEKLDALEKVIVPLVRSMEFGVQLDATATLLAALKAHGRDFAQFIAASKSSDQAKRLIQVFNDIKFVLDQLAADSDFKSSATDNLTQLAALRVSVGLDAASSAPVATPVTAPAVPAATPASAPAAPAPAPRPSFGVTQAQASYDI